MCWNLSISRTVNEFVNMYISIYTTSDVVYVYIYQNTEVCMKCV